MRVEPTSTSATLRPLLRRGDLLRAVSLKALIVPISTVAQISVLVVKEKSFV